MVRRIGEIILIYSVQVSKKCIIIDIFILIWNQNHKKNPRNSETEFQLSLHNCMTNHVIEWMNELILLLAPSSFGSLIVFIDDVP